MKLTSKLTRLMLRAFPGNEFKFLTLLLVTPADSHEQVHLSIVEIERRLSIERPTALSIKKSLQDKGIIRSKVMTDRPRAIEIITYQVDKKVLQAYCLLFEVRCRHCATATAATYVKHHPQPRSEGGNETFYLCANCDDEYHYT